jgi:hypothetical protein
MGISSRFTARSSAYVERAVSTGRSRVARQARPRPRPPGSRRKGAGDRTSDYVDVPPVAEIAAAGLALKGKVNVPAVALRLLWRSFRHDKGDVLQNANRGGRLVRSKACSPSCAGSRGSSAPSGRHPLPLATRPIAAGGRLIPGKRRRGLHEHLRFSEAPERVPTCTQFPEVGPKR